MTPVPPPPSESKEFTLYIYESGTVDNESGNDDPASQELGRARRRRAKSLAQSAARTAPTRPSLIFHTHTPHPDEAPGYDYDYTPPEEALALGRSHGAIGTERHARRTQNSDPTPGRDHATESQRPSQQLSPRDGHSTPSTQRTSNNSSYPGFSESRLSNLSGPSSIDVGMNEAHGGARFSPFYWHAEAPFGHNYDLSSIFRPPHPRPPGPGPSSVHDPNRMSSHNYKTSGLRMKPPSVKVTFAPQAGRPAQIPPRAPPDPHLLTAHGYKQVYVSSTGPTHSSQPVPSSQYTTAPHPNMLMQHQTRNDTGGAAYDYSRGYSSNSNPRPSEQHNSRQALGADLANNPNLRRIWDDSDRRRRVESHESHRNSHPDTRWSSENVWTEQSEHRARQEGASSLNRGRPTSLLGAPPTLITHHPLERRESSSTHCHQPLQQVASSARYCTPPPLPPIVSVQNPSSFFRYYAPFQFPIGMQQGFNAYILNPPWPPPVRQSVPRPDTPVTQNAINNPQASQQAHERIPEMSDSPDRRLATQRLPPASPLSAGVAPRPRMVRPSLNAPTPHHVPRRPMTLGDFLTPHVRGHLDPPVAEDKSEAIIDVTCSESGPATQRLPPAPLSAGGAPRPRMVRPPLNPPPPHHVPRRPMTLGDFLTPHVRGHLDPPVAEDESEAVIDVTYSENGPGAPQQGEPPGLAPVPDNAVYVIVEESSDNEVSSKPPSVVDMSEAPAIADLTKAPAAVNLSGPPAGVDLTNAVSAKSKALAETGVPRELDPGPLTPVRVNLDPPPVAEDETECVIDVAYSESGPGALSQTEPQGLTPVPGDVVCFMFENSSDDDDSSLFVDESIDPRLEFERWHQEGTSTSSVQPNTFSADYFEIPPVDSSGPEPPAHWLDEPSSCAVCGELLGLEFCSGCFSLMPVHWCECQPDVCARCDPPRRVQPTPCRERCPQRDPDQDDDGCAPSIVPARAPLDSPARSEHPNLPGSIPPHPESCALLPTKCYSRTCSIDNTHT